MDKDFKTIILAIIITIAATYAYKEIIHGYDTCILEHLPGVDGRVAWLTKDACKNIYKL